MACWKLNLAILILAMWCLPVGSTRIRLPKEQRQSLTNAIEVVKEIMKKTFQPDNFLILLFDASTFASLPSSSVFSKNLEKVAPNGFGIFEATPSDLTKTNHSAILSTLLPIARKLRRKSRSVVTVTFSEDVTFLRAFAESSLSARLLKWATKLLVVTSLSQGPLQELLNQYWTYSMMNTMFINCDVDVRPCRWSVMLHQPYSPEGTRNVEAAIWTESKGLRRRRKYNFYPPKYSDFHGASINVTALPFPPYWIEEEYKKTDGSKGIIYSGTDAYLLFTVAQKLNFTCDIIAAPSWGKGNDLVAERKSFFTAVYHMVLPNRLEQFEYSYEYEYAFLGFGTVKPSLKPQWESLYYPLTNAVWTAILACTLIVPVLVYLFRRVSEEDQHLDKGLLIALQDTFGTLLGQGTVRLPTTVSGRTLMVAWLIFAFIIGTAYRGNLTAFLTSPKYPPRAETLEELVNSVDLVTSGPYMESFKVFFSKSDHKAFRMLADILIVGPAVEEGLRQALETRRSAQISGLRYMQHIIAEKYTRPDGTTDLYVGREPVLPGLSGWPIPHDAPYKENIDWCIMAVLEAGLYEHWSSEFIEKAWRNSIRKQTEYIAARKAEGIEAELPSSTGSSDSDKPSSRIMALTVKHMQGPLLLLALGLMISFLIFATEILSSCTLKCP